MPDVRLLILTAILPEARPLVKRLHLVKTVASVPFWIRDDLAVAVVGIGAAHLHELLEIPAIAQFAIKGKGGIVMAGLAGGLASELHVGSVVVDGKNLPSSVARSGARIGLIHTTDHIVATVAEKAQLLADTGCVAVDMETAIVRRFATKRGLPFASVRGISDTARQPLNPELLTLLNAEGKPMLGRVLSMIVKKPGRVRELIALQRASSLAVGNMAATVEVLVTSGWPGGSTKRPATA